MIKIFTILFKALAFAFLLAGCAGHEDNGNGAITGKTVLNAIAVEPRSGTDNIIESRAGWNMTDRGYWHADDRVAVINTVDGVHTTFTIDAAGGSTFSGDAAYHDDTHVIGLYPHTESAGYQDEAGRQTILYTIPAEQSYVPDGVKELPMAGRAAVSGGEIDMAFHHLYALVKIPVMVSAGEEAETLVVKSIRLETPDNSDVWAQLQADMTAVDATTPPVVRRNTVGEQGLLQTSGGGTITLNCGVNGVEINKNTPVYFHIAVMPTVDGQVNSYESGLKLSFELEGVDNDIVMTNSASYRFERCGTIYSVVRVALDVPEVMAGNKIRLDVASLGLSTTMKTKNPVTIEGVDFRFSNWACTTDLKYILTGPQTRMSTNIRNKTAMPGDITKIVYSLLSDSNPGLRVGFDAAAEIVMEPSGNIQSTAGVHEVEAPSGMKFFYLLFPMTETRLEYIDVYYE
jgi:hypothetical protein